MSGVILPELQRRAMTAVAKAIARAGNGAACRDSFVLLAPSVEGSRGDAAMLDVVLSDLRERYDGRVVLFCFRRSERYAAFVERFGVEVTSLEGLARNPLALSQVVRRAHTFRFIGADVVDGVYGARNALLRLSLAHAFAAGGADSAIVSFSFSDRPDQALSRSLASLPASVDLVVRDPVSRRRLEAVLGRPLPQGADLAFLLRPAEAAPDGDLLRWIAGQRAAGRRVVGLGVNALLTPADDAPGLDRLAALARAVAAPEVALLAVPHDFRPQVSDLRVAQGLAARLAPQLGDRLRLLDSPLSAPELKAVAGRLDAIVSARMHFAIAGLSQAVPAFSLAYQGKFEGVYELLGLAGEADRVSADAGAALADPERAAGLVRGFLADRDRLAAHLAARLPAVRELSRRNLSYRSLPGAPSAAAAVAD